MNLHERNGKLYRVLVPGERVQWGDLISYDPPEDDELWDPVNSTVGKTVAENLSERKHVEFRGLVWLRECDPLIAAMIETQNKQEGRKA